MSKSIEDHHKYSGIVKAADKENSGVVGNQFSVIYPYLNHGWKSMQELFPTKIDEDVAWKTGKIVLYTAGICVVLIGGVYYVILPAVGFTSAGVGAKTAAAAWQATLGGTIASGSLFATLQSLGATGFALPTKVLTATTVGGVVTALTALRSKL